MPPSLPIPEELLRLAGQTGPALVAIDGRCGSGKTTLGRSIAQALDCALLHTDDFYLPPAERPANWRDIPGGNMDFPRLLQEVLLPARTGREIVYRPYVCRAGSYGPEVVLPPKALTVVEGSYCLHPALRNRYDLRLFLTCDAATQARRLLAREGEAGLRTFRDLWIPLEERYIREHQVDRTAQVVLDTSQYF